MAYRFARLAGIALLVLAGGGAKAGTLTSATWYQTLPEVVPGLVMGFPMTRTSAQLGASGTSTASSIAVNLSYPPLSDEVFFPYFSFFAAVSATQGGPQAITATAGMADAAPGVPGTLIVMSAVHSGMGVNQSMFVVGPNTVGSVPLSVGQAGQFLATFFVLGINHFVTLDFHAWTPGTLTFTGLTSNGAALPDVVAMGSFDLTPLGGGTVTLVAPSKVTITSLAGTLHRRTASFATLTLSFVPEPGSMLLLGAGALALCLFGRQRS